MIYDVGSRMHFFPEFIYAKTFLNDVFRRAQYYEHFYESL